MVTSALIRLLVVFLMVAANAFFVAAEFALVSVRDTRIQQLLDSHRIGARTVQRLHLRLDELLSAVQLGVTLASLALGWIGEATLAHIFEPALAGIPHSTVWAHATAVTFAFIAITYLHVTLGELVPKSVALHRAERVALAVAGPMEVFMKITRPFVVLMTKSARVALRVFGAKEVKQAGVHSPEELKMIVTASRRFGMVQPFQEEVVLHALEMENIEVREVMVPRPDIFSLPADMNVEHALTRVVEEQHSRIPVYDPQRGPEHIIGLLYSKDLTRWMRLRLMLAADAAASTRIAGMQVRQIMRDVLVVPETKVLSDLLQEFKHKRRHLAVVVDEYGSTAGVVTVEDVLEQLVGEIEDEFDIMPQPLTPGASSMVLDGATPIRDLEMRYQLALPRDEGFETLGGFVLSRLQKLPRGGESFEHEGRRYTVLEMEGRRIAKLKIEPSDAQTAKLPADR